jgi:hypothetical protein
MTSATRERMRPTFVFGAKTLNAAAAMSAAQRMRTVRTEGIGAARDFASVFPSKKSPASTSFAFGDRAQCAAKRAALTSRSIAEQRRERTEAR